MGIGAEEVDKLGNGGQGKWGIWVRFCCSYDSSATSSATTLSAASTSSASLAVAREDGNGGEIAGKGETGKCRDGGSGRVG